MEYLIGVVLGVVVCVFALLTGFDRDRAFYPTVLAVIPTYYILFAAMGSSTQAVVIESTVTCAFWALAVVGFKKNLWLIGSLPVLLHCRAPILQQSSPRLFSVSSLPPW
jgi:hypothetical protein